MNLPTLAVVHTAGRRDPTSDVVVAALLIVVGLLAEYLRSDVAGRGWASVAVAGGLVVALNAPIAWRRRAPRASALIVSCAVAVVWGSQAVDLTILAGPLAFYGLGRWYRWPSSARWFAALGTGLTTVALVLTLDDPLRHPWQTFLGRCAVIGCAFGFGVAVARAQAQEERSRLEREERLAQERSVAERRAAIDERNRIARELHDVVAHSLSIMVVQATLAERLFDDDPDGARRALASVAGVGRSAMGDMGRILGLLGRDGAADGGRSELLPQPGLADLGPLVERYRAAGLPVSFEQSVVPAPLSPGVELTIVRIVQEALTNVLRHTDHAPTRVRIDYLDPVVVEVVDDGRGARVRHDGDGARDGSGDGGGRGLLGMRERVAALGGSLTAGPVPAGGFRVCAILPAEKTGVQP